MIEYIDSNSKNLNSCSSMKLLDYGLIDPTNIFNQQFASPQKFKQTKADPKNEFLKQHVVFHTKRQRRNIWGKRCFVEVATAIRVRPSQFSRP